MKHIAIQLARLVRETKRVVVAVPDDFIVSPESTIGVLGAVYDADEGEGFELDPWWGCDEGEHAFIRECPELEAQYELVVEDGEIFVYQLIEDE